MLNFFMTMGSGSSPDPNIYYRTIIFAQRAKMQIESYIVHHRKHYPTERTPHLSVWGSLVYPQNLTISRTQATKLISMCSAMGVHTLSVFWYAQQDSRWMGRRVK